MVAGVRLDRMAVFSGLIIWAVVALINQITGRANDRDESSAGAMRILEERFARGEIDRDQFDDMREALGKSA